MAYVDIEKAISEIDEGDLLIGDNAETRKRNGREVEMNIGKAMAIFLQIDNEEYSNEEKAMAIYIVMNMTTHNSIKKDDMLKALKWLWHSAYEIN